MDEFIKKWRLNLINITVFKYYFFKDIFGVIIREKISFSHLLFWNQIIILMKKNVPILLINFVLY